MSTPTPRTDEAWAAWPYAGSGMSVHVGRELERELTEAIEQRDALAEALRDIVKSVDPYEMYKTAKRALERFESTRINKPATHHEEWGDEQSTKPTKI